MSKEDLIRYRQAAEKYKVTEGSDVRSRHLVGVAVQAVKSQEKQFAKDVVHSIDRAFLEAIHQKALLEPDLKVDVLFLIDQLGLGWSRGEF